DRSVPIRARQARPAGEQRLRHDRAAGLSDQAIDRALRILEQRSPLLERCCARGGQLCRDLASEAKIVLCEREAHTRFDELLAQLVLLAQPIERALALRQAFRREPTR